MKKLILKSLALFLCFAVVLLPSVCVSVFAASRISVLNEQEHDISLSTALHRRTYSFSLPENTQADAALAEFTQAIMKDEAVEAVLPYPVCSTAVTVGRFFSAAGEANGTIESAFSYQLPEQLAGFAGIELAEGRIIDFSKDYLNSDTVEIMATEGSALSVGDKCSISLGISQQDGNGAQTLTGEVVGIVKREVVLPYSEVIYDFKYQGASYDSVYYEKGAVILPDLRAEGLLEVPASESPSRRLNGNNYFVLYKSDAVPESYDYFKECADAAGCVRTKDYTRAARFVSYYAESACEPLLIACFAVMTVLEVLVLAGYIVIQVRIIKKSKTGK